MADKKDYIDRPTGYDLSLPGPYHQQGVTMCVYVVPADKAALQRTLDRYLNVVSTRWEYRPLTGHVMGVFADMKSVTSADPNLGHMHEIDVSFFVPALRFEKGGFLPHGIAAFIPYLYVNNDWAMATGREVFGFRKEVGLSFSDQDPNGPDWPGAEALTHVDAMVMLEKSAAANLSPHRLIDLHTPAAPRARESNWSHLHEAFDEVVGRLLGGVARDTVRVIESLFGDHKRQLSLDIPTVFLKQFRDAVEADKACYQTTFEANGAAKLDTFRGGGFLRGDYAITLSSTPSHPIAQELGLDDRKPIPVEFAFEVDVDFDMDLPRSEDASDRTPSPVPSPQPEPVSGPRQKVAVLGGGIAGLAAAMELSERSDAYDITVYQHGWRLGGKCASGRNPEYGNRIEEHGLHILFGFYENAFNLMQQAYKGADRPPSVPLRSVDDAFKGMNSFTLEEEVNGEWIPWTLEFPTLPGQPGARAAELAQEPLEADLAGHLAKFLEFFHDQFEKHSAPHGDFIERAAFQQIKAAADAVLRFVETEANHELEHALKLVPDFAKDLWKLLEKEVERHTPLRRLWILVELGCAVAAGTLRLVLSGNSSFDTLDKQDFTVWLGEHSALGELSEITRKSAPLKLIYELVFAYLHGDTAKPRLAAGAALRGLFRIVLGYRGNVAYQMQAGTGDVLAMPMYETLCKRNVNFAWFSDIDELVLDPDSNEVTNVKFRRQAEPKGDSYRPWVAVKDLRCWPSIPNYDDINQGEELELGDELPAGGYDLESPWTAWRGTPDELVKGTDYDIIILAIPVGALKTICAGIGSARQEWADMLSLETVPTQAAQLWLTPTTTDLGWDEEEAKHSLLIGSFQDPQSNWGNFNDLLKREDWPASPVPQTFALFCGPFDQPESLPPNGPVPEFPKRQNSIVGKQTKAWMNESLPALWPNARADKSFNWELLYDTSGAKGELRFDSQYHKANVRPWEQYVLTLPEATGKRLTPDGSGIDGLYLAGDWTLNGLNIGCVEATVISARQAVRSLLGEHYPIWGEKDHL